MSAGSRWPKDVNRRLTCCRPYGPAGNSKIMIKVDWWGDIATASRPPYESVELPPIEPENSKLDSVVISQSLP